MAVSSNLFITILSSIYCLQCTQSQTEPSCYHYGCGAYDPSQQCQCNRQCEESSNCCSDFSTLCMHGNFEECRNAPSIKEDRRTNKHKLTFISFNAEWMFLDYSHSMGSNYCPGTGCSWTNTTAAYNHMYAIAEYLDTFNADIILLQETCDCWTVQQLINSMKYNGASYKPYLLKGTDTGTGQNVALITKIDPLQDLYRTEDRVVYPIANSPCPYSGNCGTQGCSKHFRSRFYIDGISRNLSIFNFHFLAYPTDKSRCVRREGQASVIANMIREEAVNGNLIIAAGDYNDYASSVCDINCHKPISSVESVIRTSVVYTNLVNAAGAIEQSGERYGAWYNCKHDCVVNHTKCLSLIDHVLVSQELYDIISDIKIDHGFINGCDTNYSDHWPYVITLDLTKYQDAVAMDWIKNKRKLNWDNGWDIDENRACPDTQNKGLRTVTHCLYFLSFFVFTLCL